MGEGPGSNEVEQGYPFIGPSGKVVTQALRAAGVDREHVFFVNALLCARPGGETAMLDAVDHCRARLQQDLLAIAPTAICALGGTAMTALQLPVTAVSLARGTVQYSPLLPGGPPVIGAIHPAALLRGGAGEVKGGKQKMNVEAQAQFLFADIAKAYKVSTGEVSPIWADDILVVHEADQVIPAMNAILDDVYRDGLLGLDLEWDCPGFDNALHALGANAHLAQITLVGVGCPTRAVSFKWDALEAAGGLEILQAALEDENLPKLAHNKQADRAVWEAKVGPIQGRFLDSMIAHHVACPGIDHDLQQVVSQFLCVPPWKVQHAQARKNYEARLKVEAKEKKVQEKVQIKQARIEAHEARNEAKRAEAEAKKAARMQEHEARNAALAADKLARKAKKKMEVSNASVDV